MSWLSVSKNDVPAGLYGVSGGSRLKFNFRTRDISVGFGKPDSLSCCWDGQLFFWTFVIIFFTEPAQFFFLNGTFYRMLLPETRMKFKYLKNKICTVSIKVASTIKSFVLSSSLCSLNI